ncbi:hypothetical protein CPB86DRAFT_728715, partial [Serendipita vermifera]
MSKKKQDYSWLDDAWTAGSPGASMAAFAAPRPRKKSEKAQKSDKSGKLWNNILHQNQSIRTVDLDKFDRTRAPTAPFATVAAADAGPSTDACPSTFTPPVRECVICTDTDVEFTTSPPTERCKHEPETCVDCIREHIRVAVVSENTTEVKCPSIGCSEVLEYDEVQRWADDETFAKFAELLVQRLLQGEPNYVTCLNPACDAGQVHSGENFFPIVTCYKCGDKTCYTHRVAWHDSYTCKEWDRRGEREEERAREDQLSREWVEGQTKRCPGEGCGRPIRKEEGCDHMTCRRPGGCGHEFCWLCLAPYEPIRIHGCDRHKASCRWYSGREPETQGQDQQQGTRSRWRFWRRN